MSEALAHAPGLSVVSVHWTDLRNSAFQHEGSELHAAASRTGQADCLAATIEADTNTQNQDKA